jgi:hypothetical protein
VYIRLEGNDHILVKTERGPDGVPREVVLGDLGQDPELNLFFAAEQGRRKNPELWEGVNDFQLLQALQNYKRRLGNYRPALVAVPGKRADSEGDEGTGSEDG